MKRIEWIDDLKGLGIFLIVLGHGVATVRIISNGNAEWLHNLFAYIYSFHVPFFFLLAGLTYSTRRDFASFAKAKFLRLMVPYFVWGLASAALFATLGKATVQSVESAEFAKRSFLGAWWTPFVSILQGGGWPNGMGFKFNGVLWFLPVLFTAELIYYPIAKRISRLWQFAAITSLIAVVLSPVYWPYLKLHLPYGLSRVSEYLVFIMMGDIVGRRLRDEMPELTMRNVFGCAVGFAVALGAGAGLCRVFGEVVRYPLAVPKALATIIPLLLIARYRAFRWFIVLAPHTIAIMLFHKFLLVPMQIVVTKVGFLSAYPMVGSVGCVIAFSFVCVLVCFVISKVLSRFMPWSIGVR